MTTIDIFEVINGEKNELPDESAVASCENCSSHKIFNFDGKMICENCNMEQSSNINSLSLTNNPFDHWNISFFSGAKLYMKNHKKTNKSLYNMNRKIIYKYHDRNMFKAHNKVKKLLIKNNMYDEAILFETIKIFSNIKRKIKNKENLNRGLIAMSFYYASKDKYIIYSQKELAKLFDVKIKFVSSANNKINRLISNNVDLKTMINKKYLTIGDYFYTVKHKFPELNKFQLSEFKHVLNKISELYYVKINVPKSIIGGMLKNFILLYEISDITDKKILERIGTSPNSLYKYKKIMFPLMDNITKSIGNLFE